MQPGPTGTTGPVFIPVIFESGNTAISGVTQPIGPIGPTGNGWVFGATGTSPGAYTTIYNPGTTGTSSSGYYQVAYKIDVRTNATVYDIGTATARVATLLTLTNPLGGNPTELPGTVTVAEAPNEDHQYSLSNTVLINYTQGYYLTLYWWGAYWAGSTGGTYEGNANVNTITLGPNVNSDIVTSNNTWMFQSNSNSHITTLATRSPNNNSPIEATASLIITRITYT